MRSAITPRIGGFLAVAAATGLVLAGPAAAQRLVWHETAKDGKSKVMTYTVDSLTITKTGWKAHITFSNVSKATIGLQSGFGVAFYRDPKAISLALRAGFAPATKFSSKLPTSLKPGASWSGTISGTGGLTSNQRLYARIVFGPFANVPGQTQPIVWITDHAKTIGKLSATPVPPVAGPVI